MQLNKRTLRGTADKILYHADGALDIVDYKFGISAVDEAEDNLQGQCYALGAMRRWNCPTAQVHFLMPRQGEVSKHTFTPEDIGRIRTRLLSIAAVQRKRNRPWVPNPVSCQWCSAKDRCPALARKAVLIAATANLLPVPRVCEPGALVTVEDRNQAQALAGIMEDWAKQVKRANAAACIEQGLELPDYRLVRRAGNRSFLSTLLVAQYLVSEGISTERFLAGCRIAVGETEKILSEHATEKGLDPDEFAARILLTLEEQGLIDKAPPVAYLQRKTRNKKLGG